MAWLSNVIELLNSVLCPTDVLMYEALLSRHRYVVGCIRVRNQRRILRTRIMLLAAVPEVPMVLLRFEKPGIP